MTRHIEAHYNLGGFALSPTGAALAPVKMNPRDHDLASLLDPISVGEFFGNHWERAPLFVQQRGESYYEGLLTNRDIEEIISNSDARYPALMLAKGGQFFPPEAYTSDVQVGQSTLHGVPDVDKIAAEYAKGASITMSALHRTWAPLRALCSRLDEELDHSTNANVYVTPGRAAGFPPHYDTHDVLVLQIAGKKRWLIDEPTIKLPHQSQVFKPEGFTPGRRLMEIELHAGDLLYLPRGYVHSTTTSECHSLHVTVGINIYTWADLVGDLVPSRVENEELRRALPAGFASRAELRPALKDQLTRMLPSLAARIDFDQMFNRLTGMTKAWRRRPTRFRADVIVILPDSLLQAPAANRYNLMQNGGDVTLDFEQKVYLFPAPTAPLLSAMCTRPTFRLTEISDAPNMEAVLRFARYLQSIGFLRSAG